MHVKRMCVAAAVMLGFVGSQASGAYLAAYWDGNYADHWITAGDAAAVRDALEAAGYEILDADQLKDWMDARIADGASSVVVFCKDVAPETVVETNTADCTLRQYLDAGGKIVFYGDIPFYNQGNPGGGETNWGDGGAVGILGFNAAGGTWDAGDTVTITDAGQEWGLTETWASVRPAAPDDVDIILAANGTGQAAAWVKHYVEGDTTHGFVRIWDRGNVYSVEDLMRVAEYGLGPNPLARGANPRNGSMIDQTTVQASWQAGDYAALHDVYFGESFEEVSAATPDDADLYVGRQATTELPMGMPGGPSPDGLTPGKTYYWRVDEINDGEPDSPWKGEVWSFRVRPQTAWDPSPADGMIYVHPHQDLTWKPGINTLFHTVYVGESFDEVNEAVAGGIMLTGLTLDPGPLAVDTTYYWRVDEFTFPGSATYKGDVWSFTTVPVVAVTDPQLAGSWTLDEGMGTTAVDWSGHGNHGTLVGGLQWVEGYHGGALEFDGRDDYVDCGSGSSLNITDAVTVAAWVKLAGPANDRKVAGNQDSRTGGYKLGVYGNLAEFEIRTAANQAVLNRDVTGGTTLQSGVWYHLTGVYSPGEYIRTYVNGELDRELLTTEILGSSTGTLKLGREPYSNACFWLGALDDARVYSAALGADQIAEVMRGNPLLAGNPEPGPGAVVDIRDATALRWSPGDTAASHDVYFGTDRDALELQGNQPGTSFSLAGLVELGGGDYFWRIDEVEADATTIHEGYTWRFTVPAYLIVDDFESYDDDENRLYEIWVDGVVNGTGSYVGYQAANNGTFGETVIVHSGGQSMPIQYDNTVAAGVSEADRTFTPAQNWTAQGVTTLVIHFRGAADNTGQLYAKINGTKVPYNGDPADIASRRWIAWEIDLAAVGVNLTSVSTLTIGIEGGGTGTVYVDDIWLTKP